MNTEKLTQLTNKNSTAKRILDLVAERQRNTVYTAFNGLKTMLKHKDKQGIDNKEFNKAFSELERIGMGKVNRTPSGAYKGFWWKVSVRDIGKAYASKERVREEPEASKERISIIILRRGKSAKVLETDEENVKHIEAILNQ